MTERLTETLAGIELRTIPSGLVALDALVKEAEVDVRFAGDIDPSHFLIVFEGALANVEAALQRAIAVGASDTLETLLLPRAHGRLGAATSGEFAPPGPPAKDESAVGVMQSHTVLGIIAATDRALKAAEVDLLRLRFATELAGQGHAVIAGAHFDVAAALEAAAEHAGGALIETRIIPRAARETFAAAAQRQSGPRALRSLEP